MYEAFCRGLTSFFNEGFLPAFGIKKRDNDLRFRYRRDDLLYKYAVKSWRYGYLFYMLL
jgi:hypothetical protein